MALANVAVELAQRGRRVLAVDFDLEAPGLEMFDLPRPEEVTPGIVDFVSEYLISDQAPAVDRFIFESPGVGRNGGGLWMMPSGAPAQDYANNLASINWGELYERRHGYLLFEDLKEQWKNVVMPDYVFIDSRTGHTDVGGICTRQLPDAVAIFFFPNTQNLRGLTKVVKDIRSEKKVSNNEVIHLHFIISNVPDLDDEDQILEKSIDSFKTDLEFKNHLTIHRYDSLSLLNQAIFTKDRPRSRLAKEYKDVVTEVVRNNPQDREGVLDSLASHDSMRQYPTNPEDWVRQQDKFNKYLEIAEENLRNDGEVLFQIGVYRNRLNRSVEALELFDQAIANGFREPEVYLSRARSRQINGINGASEDAKKVINTPNSSPHHVLRALYILHEILGDENLIDIVQSTDFLSKAPETRVWIAQQHGLTTRSKAEIILAIVSPLSVEIELHEAEIARHLLVLCSISLGKFSEAIEVIRAEEPDVKAMSIETAFNYGMALWGETEQIVCGPFARAISCFMAKESQYMTANNLQCMAIAHWATGKKKEAHDLAHRALVKIRSRGRRREFSCWRYLEVQADEFEQDMNEIFGLIDGNETIKPRFFSPLQGKQDTRSAFALEPIT